MSFKGKSGFQSLKARGSYRCWLVRMPIVSLALQLLMPVSAALANPVHTAAVPSNAPSLPSNLNLSSTAKISSVSSLTHQVSINIGGITQQVNSSALLTPAEQAAVYQVVNSGHQTLNIGANGAAVGGTLFISGTSASSLQAMVVPQHVSVFDNLALAKGLNLAGDLSNSGNLYLYSSSAKVNSATINANNIYNLAGGLISSVLPSSYKSLSAGPFDFTLNASNSLNNAGTISSSGALTLQAASITNSPGAVVQASNNLAMVSPAVTNAGLLSSLNGSVNFSAMPQQSITVNNVGGTVQALSGNINFRDASYDGSGNISVTGGSWDSQQLNLFAGQGTISANLGAVTGIVNNYGAVSHVFVDSPVLKLGAVGVSGDPTYYNDNGYIEITSNISVNEDLAILSSGDIDIKPGVTSISTTDTTGQGHDIVMVAGANLTVTIPAGANPVIVSSSDAAKVSVIVTGSGASGNINNDTGSSLTISAQSTGGPINTPSVQAGGNITLLAFGNAVSGGQINLANTTINTSSATGNAGNITIIAGSQQSGQTVISTGNLLANGGAGINYNSATGSGGNGGTIIVAAAIPSVSAGGVVFSTNGSISSGSFSIGALTNNNILTGNISANGGAAAAQGSIRQAGNGGVITVSTAGNLTVNGAISASGGHGGDGVDAPSQAPSDAADGVDGDNGVAGALLRQALRGKLMTL